MFIGFSLCLALHVYSLVFSQSLLSLDLIEEMLSLSSKKVEAARESEEDASALDSLPEGFYQTWFRNVDYFRMDGSSLGKSRQRWINEFNDVSDERFQLRILRLFFFTHPAPFVVFAFMHLCYNHALYC